MKLAFRRSLDPTNFSITVAVVIIIVCALWISFGQLKKAAFNAFAILSVPESEDDRQVVTALEAVGLSGVISESSQWIDIAGFGSMERVPLDQYSQRIDPVDPRDDGYAERLKTYFEFDGERRFFIPLVYSKTETAERIASALPNRRYGFTVPSRITLANFALFIAATVIALLLSGISLPIILGLPALLALAGYGTGGLAGAALVVLAIQASKDSTTALAGQTFSFRSLASGVNVVKSVFRYDDSVWISLGLVGMGIVVAILSDVPAILAVIAVLAAALSSALYPVLKAADNSRRGHPRFAPLKIIANSRERYREVLRTGPVFLAAILLSLVANSGFSQTVRQSIRPDAWLAKAVTLDDYRDHIEFQRSFAFMRVGSDGRMAYRHFTLDAEGLLKVDSIDTTIDELPELPPMERYLLPTQGVFAYRNSPIVKWIMALAGTGLIAASMLSIFVKRQRRVPFVYLQKKAAA